MAAFRLTWLQERKFFVLLLSFLLLFIIHPILEGFGLKGAKFLLTVFFSIILFFSIYVVSEHKKLVFFAMVLAVPAVGSEWVIGLFDAAPIVVYANLLSEAVLFIIIASTILEYVLKKGAVTGEKIYAAICVYLFIGLTWALLYELVYIYQPEAFALNKPKFTNFIYYSFVTLSTLGYGDISPVTPPAQALAYVEAIVGQIYLTVLVARLVGLHIAHPHD